MKENRTTLIFYYLLSFHFLLINDHRNTFFQACTSIMFTLKDVPLNICIIRYLKLEFDFRPSNKTNLHTSETCKTSAASTDPYSSLVYPQFQKYQTFQMNPPTETYNQLSICQNRLTCTCLVSNLICKMSVIFVILQSSA